jgi:hypothetical protein
MQTQVHVPEWEQKNTIDVKQEKWGVENTQGCRYHSSSSLLSLLKYFFHYGKRYIIKILTFLQCWGQNPRLGKSSITQLHPQSQF